MAQDAGRDVRRDAVRGGEGAGEGDAGHDGVAQLNQGAVAQRVSAVGAARCRAEHDIHGRLGRVCARGEVVGVGRIGADGEVGGGGLYMGTYLTTLKYI